jgi:hypothetical protein
MHIKNHICVERFYAPNLKEIFKDETPFSLKHSILGYPNRNCWENKIIEIRDFYITYFGSIVGPP